MEAKQGGGRTHDGRGGSGPAYSSGKGRGRGRGAYRGRGSRGGRGRGSGSSGDDSNNISGASIKKRMRSIDRLLQRETLPADVRAQKEAEKAALQKQQQQHKRSERERHFSKKYHKVKFFERRKVERQIASHQRELGRAGLSASERESLEARLKSLEADLLYVSHFPRHKKYLSLFPKENAEDAVVAKKRSRIRARILKQAEAGTLAAQPGGGGVEESEESESEEAALDDDFFEAEEEEPQRDHGDDDNSTGDGDDDGDDDDDNGAGEGDGEEDDDDDEEEDVDADGERDGADGDEEEAEAAATAPSRRSHATAKSAMGAKRSVREMDAPRDSDVARSRKAVKRGTGGRR
uniref:rRNA-processing protein EFG1 n=1 Tax=Chrysotila carterae TaxID=13221 RepID=A0A7S4BVM8_CHRCT|eukprot:6189492-Pleurochrysis_carterae.AAC.1